MPDDTTTLLRRAVAQRHTEAARGFFAALVEALAAGTDDLDEVCRIVVRACVAERIVAASVVEWLRELVDGSSLDLPRVLAGAGDIEAALGQVGPRPTPNLSRTRTRLRRAVGPALPASERRRMPAR